MGDMVRYEILTICARGRWLCDSGSNAMLIGEIVGGAIVLLILIMTRQTNERISIRHQNAVPVLLQARADWHWRLQRMPTESGWNK
jgi:hypothetical protein